MQRLRVIEVAMLVTDVGFLAYWAVTSMRLLPDVVLFADHDDPRVIAWNWSFLPLDLLVSTTGITSVVLRRRGVRGWHPLMLVSLTLTSTAGLMALAYWALRGEFDLTWWGPNLFLLLYPIPAVAWLATLREAAVHDDAAAGDPPRGVAGEEADHVGDVLRPAEPA